MLRNIPVCLKRNKWIDSIYSQKISLLPTLQSKWQRLGEPLDRESVSYLIVYQAKLLLSVQRGDLPSAFSLCEMSASEPGPRHSMWSLCMAG